MHVTPAPVDDRTFESSVTLTPEQIEANTAYFAEKGLEYSVRSLDEDGQPVAKPEDTAVADKPVDNAAPPVEDAEAKAADAELLQAKTDEARLGYNAKRTKKIKELNEEVQATKAAAATKDALLAEKDKEIERLLKAGVSTSVSAPSAFAPPAPVVAAPAASVKPAEEDIQPKEFDRAAPKKPVFADIEASDNTGDPYKAYTDALSAYSEELIQYKLDQRDHNQAQATEVARIKQQRVEDQEKKVTAGRAQENKLARARELYQDFDSLTNPEKFPLTPVLGYLLRDRIPDGFELGYQLAKPENAEFYNDLTRRTANKPRTDEEVSDLLDEVMLDLGGFRKDLKKSATGQTQPPAVPVVAAPPAPKPAVAPQQSSSTSPPRIEEAPAPAHVKGRASGAPKSLEDIDPEDTDARRAWKKQNGQM